MSSETLLALFALAITMTWTPGPNNMMLLASGANHGLRPTIPHMMGIWTGLASMLIACGLGLGQVFVLWPAGYRALQVLATLYLLWLAWKIATAASPSGVPSVRVKAWRHAIAPARR